MASWFPAGTNSDGGWRLDIVSLLAVIGESSIEEHSQALTSSWTCILPRIIPAPQVLLKPARPTRMPQVSAAVVGVQYVQYRSHLAHSLQSPSSQDLSLER